MPKFENIFVIMFSFLGMEHAKNSYFYFHRTLLSLSLQSLSISNYVINYTGTENRQRKSFKVKVTLFFNSLKNKKKLYKILDIVQSRFHAYCLIWTAKKNYSAKFCVSTIVPRLLQITGYQECYMFI